MGVGREVGLSTTWSLRMKLMPREKSVEMRNSALVDLIWATSSNLPWSRSFLVIWINKLVFVCLSQLGRFFVSLATKSTPADGGNQWTLNSSFPGGPPCKHNLVLGHNYLQDVATHSSWYTYLLYGAALSLNPKGAWSRGEIHAEPALGT